MQHGIQTLKGFTLQIPSHIQEHIETIAKHEQEFNAKRSTGERVADRIATFAGSFPFVFLHIVFFGGWVFTNSTIIYSHTFDPFPYPLLDTIVALEAILLASFILMRQSGLAKRADERDHLMLQILLLTERELSAVVRMNQQIADRVGIPAFSRDAEIREMAQPTSIDQVAQTIQENLTGE
jgi:uncharacterized membrane protein